MAPEPRLRFARGAGSPDKHVLPVYAKHRRLVAPERALQVSAMIDVNALELARVTWLRRGWPGAVRGARAGPAEAAGVLLVAAANWAGLSRP